MQELQPVNLDRIVVIGILIGSYMAMLLIVCFHTLTSDILDGNVLSDDHMSAGNQHSFQGFVLQF